MANTLRSGGVIFFCLLVGLAAVTAGVAPAAAQDSPSLPAVYHGELTVEDGSVDSPVLVEVVVDGSVQDSIVTDADGAIGGPTISDDKLEVQEPDDDSEIEFHVGGSPVTIVSANGESVDDDSIPFESGDQEIVLEADPSDLDPTVAIDITDAPDTVDADESVTVTTAIENTGPVSITDEVELRAFDNTTVDSAAIDLDINESTTTSLTWEPTANDTGDGDLTVQVGTTSVTHPLTVEALAPPPIAQPAPGGSTGGDDDDADLPAGVAGTDEQEIISDADSGLSQVRFTDATAVDSITWETVDISGTVTATTFTEAPNETGPAPGTLISTSQIDVPDTIASEPATVAFAFDPDEVADANASASDLRVYKYEDDAWSASDTAVVADDSESVLIQTDVDGFSYFAVSAVSEPTAGFSVEPDEPDTETSVSLDASESNTTHGEITAYNWTINGDTMSGETVETTFDSPGTVEIELTVETDTGETDTTIESVSVTAVDDQTDDTSDDGDTDDADTDDTDDVMGGDESDGEWSSGFIVVVLVGALLVGLAILRRRNE